MIVQADHVLCSVYSLPLVIAIAGVPLGCTSDATGDSAGALGSSDASSLGASGEHGEGSSMSATGGGESGTGISTGESGASSGATSVADAESASESSDDDATADVEASAEASDEGTSDDSGEATTGDPSEESGSGTETTGGDPDDVFAEVDIELHQDMPTFATVRWRQIAATTSTSVHYRVDREWLETPARDGVVGEHEQIVLGVPADVDFDFKLVTRFEGLPVETEVRQFRTGPLPNFVPVPESAMVDPDLVDDARWRLGALRMCCGSVPGPHHLQMIDREGRVVWYHQPHRSFEVDSVVVSSSGHILYDQRAIGSQKGADDHVRQISLLDAGEVAYSTPHVFGSFVETDEGIIYSKKSDNETTIVEVRGDGSSRTIWDCDAWLAEIDDDTKPSQCSALQVAWDGNSRTVLVSLISPSSIVQVDVDTGDIVTVWGTFGDAWSFDPPESAFATVPTGRLNAKGELLVVDLGATPGFSRVQRFAIDPSTSTLRQQLAFLEPGSRTMGFHYRATQLDGGNFLLDMGTTSRVVERTPSGEVAFEVAWGTAGSSEFQPYVSEFVAIDNLYELVLGSP